MRPLNRSIMPLVWGWRGGARRYSICNATPIIAMTANTFGENRAAQLAASMNDHVAKPVYPPLLFDTLLRWLPLPGNLAGPVGPAAKVCTDPLAPTPTLHINGLDLALCLRRIGGQPATLVRVLRRLAEVYRDGDPALAAPADDAGIARWRAACHSLRGALAAIGAEPLQQAVQDIENLLAALDQAAADVTLLAPQAQALWGALQGLAQRTTQALG